MTEVGSALASPIATASVRRQRRVHGAHLVRYNRWVSCLLPFFQESSPLPEISQTFKQAFFKVGVWGRWFGESDSSVGREWTTAGLIDPSILNYIIVTCNIYMVSVSFYCMSCHALSCSVLSCPVLQFPFLLPKAGGSVRIPCTVPVRHGGESGEEGQGGAGWWKQAAAAVGVHHVVKRDRRGPALRLARDPA